MKKVPAVRLVERGAAQALRELPDELRVAMTDKHAKQPGRLVRRHGNAPGSVVPGGRRESRWTDPAPGLSRGPGAVQLLPVTVSGRNTLPIG